MYLLGRFKELWGPLDTGNVSLAKRVLCRRRMQKDDSKPRNLLFTTVLTQKTSAISVFPTNTILAFSQKARFELFANLANGTTPTASIDPSRSQRQELKFENTISGPLLDRSSSLRFISTKSLQIPMAK